MTDYSQTPDLSVHEVIKHLYRNDRRKIYATLIRLLGSFELAEEALQDAFNAALQKWPAQGIPKKPVPWLVSAGRFKAIDTLRKQQRQSELDHDLNLTVKLSGESEQSECELIEDDQLRLIFTCCHPAIDPKIQVALTLREVCGLTTEEIANAFLVSSTTMAQRIVRGKAKIKQAHIPFELPSEPELATRLEAVLTVIYLVFNEGYLATDGKAVTRADLTSEAIRLSRLLYSLIPDSEVAGLLALMLLNESRRAARTSAEGDIVLLEQQDRSLWDKSLITEGVSLVNYVMSSGDYGFYTIQAAILATHAMASQPQLTDWQRIISLYSLLLQVSPSPVIELNQAVAIAMQDGPEAGIKIVERLLQQKSMHNYHLAHATYAELLSRAGRNEEAILAFEFALQLTKQLPAQRILQRKLDALR